MVLMLRRPLSYILFSLDDVLLWQPGHQTRMLPLFCWSVTSIVLASGQQSTLLDPNLRNSCSTSRLTVIACLRCATFYLDNKQSSKRSTRACSWHWKAAIKLRHCGGRQMCLLCRCYLLEYMKGWRRCHRALGRHHLGWLSAVYTLTICTCFTHRKDITLLLGIMQLEWESSSVCYLNKEQWHCQVLTRQS